jgi:hypothetical protein
MFKSDLKSSKVLIFRTFDIDPDLVQSPEHEYSCPIEIRWPAEELLTQTG